MEISGNRIRYDRCDHQPNAIKVSQLREENTEIEKKLTWGQ
jgi:hypothetical protein